MPREVFPFPADMDVIRAFLLGIENYMAQSSDNIVRMVRGNLVIGALGSVTSTVAWFAPDGSLEAKVPNGFATSYAMHVINAIMRELQPAGVPKQVVMEALTFEKTPGKWRIYRFFFDGAEVRQNVPFTLAGRVGVLAYRATAKP